MKIYNTTVFSYNNKSGNPCPVVLEADELNYKNFNKQMNCLLKYPENKILRIIK